VRTSLVLLATAGALLVSACSLRGDDTSNRGLVDTSWTVVSIDGVPMTARPTMTFAQDGTLGGAVPLTFVRS
jgi:heat shock protein HslJ